MIPISASQSRHNLIQSIHPSILYLLGYILILKHNLCTGLIEHIRLIDHEPLPLTAKRSFKTARPETSHIMYSLNDIRPVSVREIDARQIQ